MRALEQVLPSQARSLHSIHRFEWVEIRKRLLRDKSEIALKQIVLANLAGGFGCLASLQDDARCFATRDLEACTGDTAKGRSITCMAKLANVGRTTQVWNAQLSGKELGRRSALADCTQMLVYPENGAQS